MYTLQIFVVCYFVAVGDSIRFILSHSSSLHGNATQAKLKEIFDQKFLKSMSRLDETLNKEELKGNVFKKVQNLPISNGYKGQVVTSELNVEKGVSSDYSSLHPDLEKIIFDEDLGRFFDLWKGKAKRGNKKV